MTTPFQLDLGVSQGRIGVPLAPEGLFVLELGHALRQARHVAPGDFFEVKQSFVLDSQTAVLRFAVKIRPPDSVPSGGWLFTARLNGAIRAQRAIDAADGRSLTLRDLAISTAGANGPPATDEVAFRLERT